MQEIFQIKIFHIILAMFHEFKDYFRMVGSH